MPIHDEELFVEALEEALGQGEGEKMRKPTEVYVAGSADDVERVKRVMALVQNYSWIVTFDWTGPEGDIRTGWKDDPEAAFALAAKEIAAVRRADVFILVCPPPGYGTGCFVEAGVALAEGKEVWVVAPQRDSVFWYCSGVVKIETTQDLATRVLARIFASRH